MMSMSSLTIRLSSTSRVISPWATMDSRKTSRGSKKPSMLNRAMFLSCSPIWRHVNISKNSSIVPIPPGSMMKPSAIEYIVSFLSCMSGTTTSLVWTSLSLTCGMSNIFGSTPTTSPAFS